MFGPSNGALPMSRYIPKLVVCLREGYTVRRFFGDLGGGLTVAVIALPLAMALGIASIPASVAGSLAAEHPWLTPPAMGLYTAIVAGAVISAFGGSRVQIGGPTAAFIPIVFGIAMEHGYAGLATATLMAGVILILMGVFRLGATIKFIPYPVTTGFTAGIAVSIVASQLKDFLGLHLVGADGAPVSVPAEFVPKLQLLAQHIDTFDWRAAAVGGGSLAVLIVLRRFVPRLPGAIVAVVASAVVVSVLGWDVAHGGTVETIGSRFGGIPRSLPAPHMPGVSWALVRELFPSATTIAILAAIESLLSAVVADGMTGYRHKSDCELVAQGMANVGSALFFGVPATGAIARTVANIKSGGTTPVAGLLHAVFLLGFMLLLADLAKLIPLASLSAVLILVAWNISEIGHFRALLRAPKSDVIVLVTTFGLTVLTDLTVAVAVGMVLASMLFMKRMAEVSAIGTIREELANGRDEAESARIAAEEQRHRRIPHGVEMFEINGPFFFGVADRLKDTLTQFERAPRVFILRVKNVPAIDATGMHALDEFRQKCVRSGTRLLLAGLHAQPLFAMTQAGLLDKFGEENLCSDTEHALEVARGHLGMG
ncbi:MAG: STAS domain-containing protein [Phycisphaerales bacterium]|nr:STAS domain-containing protein [Phycisphaerales bacterium]